MKNIVKNTFLVLAAALVAFGFNSCKQDPYKYAVTKGQPVIKYVITTDPAAADSVITEASTEAVICIVGENLRSTKKVFFNDLQAIINTSFVTENTMVISVPAAIPGAVSDKIYFHAENGTIVEFPFHVAVPGPKVVTTTCDWVKPGETGHIVGNYFVDDPNVPLEVIMPDGKNAEVIGFSQTTLDYKVPAGCTEPGLITIKTIYGSCQSNFVFNDNRNILIDWDGNGQALAQGAGWRSGAQAYIGADKAGIPALDGNYICFGPDKLGPGATDVWGEDPYSFNYWPSASGSPAPLDQFPEFAEILANNDFSALKMKFELYVPKSNAWQAAGLGVYLTDLATVSAENGNNGFFTNAAFPRAYYQPWATLGAEFYTDQWITVTLPLTEFAYNQDGKGAGSAITADHLKGLTMFVWGGGETGVECQPAIAIDNIRIVP